MKVLHNHDWNISPEAAKDIQRELAKQVSKKDSFSSLSENIKTIAACAYKFDPDSDQVSVGIILYSFPDLLELEQKHEIHESKFPFSEELAAFNAAPAFIKLFESIEHEPDLLIFSGHGLDHPRGCGIASHLGILFDKPSIACSLEALYGGYRRQPKNKKGNFEALWDNKGYLIGRIFRSKDNAEPIYISLGHKVSLDTAGRIINMCLRDGRRIPRPVRRVYQYVEQTQKGSIL